MSKRPHHPEKDIMTAQEVSRYLRIPLSTLYDLTRQKKLPGVKIGKQWRYLKTDIESFIHGVAFQRMPQRAERRLRGRLRCDIPAQFQIGLSQKTHTSYYGVVENLSEHGMLLRVSSTPLQEGDPVEMSFCLDEIQKETLKLKGRVVRLQGESTYGLKFRQVNRSEKEVLRRYVG